MTYDQNDQSSIHVCNVKSKMFTSITTHSHTQSHSTAFANFFTVQLPSYIDE